MSKAKELSELGDAVTVDSGNVGIGVTPYSHHGGGTGLDIGTRGTLAYYETAGDFLAINNNIYYDGSSWKYKETAGAGQISFGNDGSFIFYRAASGTAGTSATLSSSMKIDSSGNAGIGTDSPITTLHAYSSATSTPFVVESTTNTYLGIKNTSQTAYVGAVGTAMTFENNGSECMRVLSTGDFLINSTSVTGAEKVHIAFDRTAEWGLVIANTSSTAPSGATMVDFRYAGTQTGTITSNGTTTAYNTSSDYRLKENVTYDWDATTRLKQLKPARFNFISDADTTVDGFLAHEVSSIVPEAIHGEKDEVDAQGNPKYQGIDQSKLVPLLVKTIQELEARITALESA